MSVDPPVDVYAVLGVSPDADDRELRRAYRRAVRSAHPDAGASAQAFRALQAAWEQVCTPERRAAYDARTAFAAPVLRAPRPALTARPPEGWPQSMIDRRSGTDRRGAPRGPDRRRPAKRITRPAAKAPARAGSSYAGVQPPHAPVRFDITV